MTRDKEEALSMLHELEGHLEVCTRHFIYLGSSIRFIMTFNLIIVLGSLTGLLLCMFLSPFSMIVTGCIAVFVLALVLFLINIRQYQAISKMCRLCRSEGLDYVRQIVDIVDWTSLRKDQLYKGSSEKVNALIDEFYTESARCISSIGKFDRHRFQFVFTGLILLYLYIMAIYVLYDQQILNGIKELLLQ